MTRARLLLLMGVVALLLAVPSGVRAEPVAGATPGADEAAALGLLDAAARASRSRTWSGIEYVSTWRDGQAASAVVEVSHDPVTGTHVTTGPVHGGAGADVTTPPVRLDERLLGLLVDRYDLGITGTGTCAGRDVQVVEARRDDGAVAGRFWLDRASGLAVRREVYDAAGSRLRSSVFVDLVVGGDGPEPLRLVPAARPLGTSQVGPTQVGPTQVGPTQVDGAGWRVPAELPGGFALLDAARPAHDRGQVVHLTYSDGLSTLSLFSQPGALTSAPRADDIEHDVRGTAVWVSRESPERVVWSGAGQVYTLVSDASHDDLMAVVAALPRQERVDRGALARMGRGLGRVASWLDPFG